MPKSRTRHRRNRSNAQRRRRRRRTSADPWRGHTEVIDSRHLVAELKARITDEDRRQMVLCAQAEAAGDAQGALRHYLSSVHIPHLPHERALCELVGWGDDAPGWVWSRWVVDQAYRWMLFHEDERVSEAVVSTIVTAYPEVDPEHPLGLSPHEFCTRIAATDWVCEQLATFEYGGLLDFLDLHAGPFLVRRADRVREWAHASMGGFTLDDVDRDQLLVTDLGTRQPRRLLNLGALSERDRGTAVLGRVVPVAATPGAMFESRPVAVDLRTARTVARHGEELWLAPVGAAREEGRLAHGFSHTEPTPLGSDIVLEPPPVPGADQTDEPGRVRELLASGLSLAAANGVAVCEVGLVTARVAPEGLAACAPHVAAVLSDRGTYEAAQKHCTDIEHQDGWALLAACVPEPIRSRCVALSAACDRS